MIPPFEIVIPEKFKKKFYADLPSHKKDAFDEAIVLLHQNPKHPSLNLKPMHGRSKPNKIYEARINGGYRCTMDMIGNQLRLRKVGPHDIERNP